MKRKQQSGFTLMELMITVAIMGILSAIVYPSYVKSVQKGKRADAKVELLSIAQLQEGYFAQNMSYANTLSTLGLAADTIDTDQREYTITIGDRIPSNCDGTNATPCLSYRLDAIPLGRTQVNDTECPRFTLSSTGRKGAGSGASPEQIRKCWR